jgi:hypothetical protein
MARAILVMVMLAAAAARAGGSEAEEEDAGWCSLLPGEDGKLQPMVSSEVVKRCSRKLCAGTYYQNVGFGHGALCLLITDVQGNAKAAWTVAQDPSGQSGLRWLSDDTLEIAYGTGGGVAQRRYRVDEQGKLSSLKRPAPPAPPSAPSLEVKRDGGDCNLYGNVLPECTGTAPDERVRRAAAQSCEVHEEKVGGTCSKAGCIGVVSPGTDTGVCVTWVRKGQKPQRLAFLPEGAPSGVSLLGTKVCVEASGGCPTGCEYSACADVSGPKPVWSAPMPPPDVVGDGDYEVLKFKGAPPQINGKADEPEWKGATLWMNTVAHVEKGVEAWHGPEDASAEWIFRWVDGAMVFLVRVRDDQVVAGDASASNDALVVGPAVLTLAPKGKVSASGAPQATCAWAEAPKGYRMECSIPLKDLQLDAPSARWEQGLLLQDSDKPGESPTVLGSRLRGRAWKTYPPPWEEILPILQPPW